MRQGKPLVFSDTKHVSDSLKTVVRRTGSGKGVRAFVLLPLLGKTGPIGVLSISNTEPVVPSEEEIRLLSVFAGHVAAAIENARLLERLRELSITDELTGLYNRRHFYEVLDAEINRAQRYDRSFCLVMLDVDGFKQYNDTFGHISGDGILQSLAQTLKSSSRKSDTGFRCGGDEFAIILPSTSIARAKQIVGRIRSKWLKIARAQHPTVKIRLGLSAGIAQFPENAEAADGLVFLADTALYRSKRRRGYRTTLVSDLGAPFLDASSGAPLQQVYAMAATVDARGPQTHGHSKRVAALSEMIGKAIGMSEKELRDLYAAALLHDIGKIGVPDAILTKPGELTEYEWLVMKNHSAEGARIVGHVAGLSALVPIIFHHHEWYDGTGYPEGLKGQDIPLGARIIGVADAYDTATTPRTYQDAVSGEGALEELRGCSGTQFDPELVEALCQVMNEATRAGLNTLAQIV